VNVLIVDPHMPLEAFADLGVRRVSIGGGSALVGWGGVKAAAERMKDGYAYDDGRVIYRTRAGGVGAL
jgi:2-methylisocitrate lyase-like PEP mutase family enzyme